MNVNIKKLNKDAVVPQYATKGAAAFDLHATKNVNVGINGEAIGTGLAFEIPEGYAMFVFSRSGDGFNKSIRLANCVGVIDSDYRGEVMVKLKSDDLGGYHHIKEVSPGDRIAQAIILPVQQVGFTVVDELSSTDRGEGGFGSTGVK